MYRHVMAATQISRRKPGSRHEDNPVRSGARLSRPQAAGGSSLSPRRRSGERVRERGFGKRMPIRKEAPLSPLSMRQFDTPDHGPFHLNWRPKT